MKQETIEEAAAKYAEGKSSSSVFNEAHIRDFINGAKWQQETMYSEEEIVYALLLCSNKKFKNSLEVKEWFKQFKK